MKTHAIFYLITCIFVSHAASAMFTKPQIITQTLQLQTVCHTTSSSTAQPEFFFITTPKLEDELDSRYTRNKNILISRKNKYIFNLLSQQNRSIENFYFVEIMCNNNMDLKITHLNTINQLEMDIKNISIKE